MSSEQTEENRAWTLTKTYGPYIAGAIAVPVAVPLVLGAVGFGAGGIATGTIAAKVMSVAAVANGGGIAAGGAVAVCQSVGAAGLGATWTVIGGSAGLGAVKLGKGAVSWLSKKENTD